MILTRLAKAIREQNWFAVSLEFIIVILGVVIGFQISEWRAAIDDRDQEQIYLTRLHDDMVQSRVSLETEIEQMRDWNADARQTLEALLSGEPDAVGGDGFELIASTRLNLGSAQRATLNELVNGGQMNLIRDPDLRRRIARTDAELQSLADYNFLLSQTLPPINFAIQSRLRPTPGRVYGAEYDFQALAEDEEFINALGHALRLTNANISWIGRMIDQVSALEAALAEALELPSDAGADAEPEDGA